MKTENFLIPPELVVNFEIKFPVNCISIGNRIKVQLSSHNNLGISNNCGFLLRKKF